MRRRYLTAFVMLLVAGMFAFEYYFLTPRSEALRETIETRYNAMRRDEQFVRDAGVTRDGMRSLEKEMKTLDGRLIPEKGEFLASARLQEEVSKLADEAGLKVGTTRTLAVVKIESFSAIPLYLEGSGTIKQISDFLKAAEADTMLIKIDKLGLTVTNMQNPRDLRFKIQISGLARV